MKKWMDWKDALEKTAILSSSESGWMERSRLSAARPRPSLTAPTSGSRTPPGSMLLEAKDMDHAVELAKGCPILEGDGMVLRIAGGASRVTVGGTAPVAFSSRGNASPDPARFTLRSSVELKRRPIEGPPERVVRMQQGELGAAEGLFGAFAPSYFLVHLVHQPWCGGIAHIPQGTDHVVGTGAQKRPRQAYQAFARVRSSSCSVASGDRYQVSAQPMLN